MKAIPYRLLSLLALGAFACAADRPHPDDRPGASCESSADCNRDDAGTRSCGSLRLCVAGHCERGAGSQLAPCSSRDAGR